VRVPATRPTKAGAHRVTTTRGRLDGRLLQVLAGVFVLAVAGCSMHANPVRPTHQVLEQIGLPVYPGAREENAAQIDQGIASAHVHSLSVSLMTNDDMDRVVNFYAERLPKTARRMVIPMGFAKDVAFQFFDKSDQKQVTIISIKNTTMIQLQSMQLVGTPTPTSATPR